METNTDFFSVFFVHLGWLSGFLFLPDGGEDAIVALVGGSQDAERGVVF